MASPGWIYLRIMPQHGYCFGKTNNPKRRDSEYRKENPTIKTVYNFLVHDMDEVEQELMRLTKHLRVQTNSKEWIRLGEESKAIVDGVRKRHECMTRNEWIAQAQQEEKAKKQELERRREQERRREEEQRRISATTGQSPPVQPVRPPPKPCPYCRFSAKWVPMRGYHCARCHSTFH
jgi:hypothetical protein